MKISNLKKLNEKIPDWVKMPFAPLLRHQLIHNTTFINQYHGLERSNKLTEHEQVNMIRKCLINAYKHIFYYHRIFDEIEFDPYRFSSIKELEKIPVLTKEVLQKEYNNLSADNVTNFYGHSERAVFAEKNKTEGYVFNSYYGITEINEKNEIIVTGFINPKMPLIRYIVDDSAIQLEDGIYEIVGHHSSEVLYGDNGIQISTAAFNVHDDTFKDVEAYQFVQNVIGECELHIVSDVDVNLFSINQTVQEKLGKNIRCKVMRKESIQYTNRGKYKMIIQNCKNDGERKFGWLVFYSYNDMMEYIQVA